MFEEINRELERLHEGMVQFRSLNNKLESLNEQLNAHEIIVVSLENALKKENLDVEKISKTSLSSLFYTLLGSREQQMEKERQEALAAKLKLDQCLYEIQDLKSRITQLTQERAPYADCERQYHALLEKKRDAMLEQHGAFAGKIIELENGMLSCKGRQKEIDEAIAAGNDVVRSINRVTESLRSAENWGTWDLLGGGLISDMAKHSRIDDARAEASQVSVLLNRFRTELADVRITSDIHIEIDGFTKFADFFFDGLIADWVVQSKIHDSQASVAKVEQEVHNVMSKLSELKGRNDEEEKRLNSQLTELITKS